MKILICWPPSVPSYFNAGHRLPAFSVAAFLRKQRFNVDVIDAGALNFTWKEFGSTLFQGKYDVVVIFNDFDMIEGVRRAADYAKAILPKSQTITVGRLSNQIPKAFINYQLDAIAKSGDYESSVLSIIKWFDAGCTLEQIPNGQLVNTPLGWKLSKDPGTYLDPQLWEFPDVTEIPYLCYENLYKDDQNKFCGIPDRRELVVPVARGCPIGCEYCDVPWMQGSKERRVSVEKTLQYIQQSFQEEAFEYVSFYAPTFTLNKHWVRELCKVLIKTGQHYPWKCATTLQYLDEELIALMAESGCIRISVGVETLEHDAAKSLPRAKNSPSEQFQSVARWCQQYKVELNCFVIVGLPGTTLAGTRQTITMIQQANARARPTLYTPYHQMHEQMSEREISFFNRQIFSDVTHLENTDISPEEYLEFIFAKDLYETTATQAIPERLGK
ncbi:B12-binding domain-containing radical SAM protein [Pseudoalteromonas sp. S16_S37]|uniref:B12-binding domain-containing radical SAM protein n=1 Tax=Pseudoalteromonas sp. S16_S37 TaxID=2720228 RepID=UPI0016809ED6|nr:radical SAM protein [Pseudoalteromonas sp. S16_S37]MBD1583311.1 radical SAM protein [Pseudoalteromonas sp. S16_S37]